MLIDNYMYEWKEPPPFFLIHTNLLYFLLFDIDRVNQKTNFQAFLTDVWTINFFCICISLTHTSKYRHYITQAEVIVHNIIFLRHPPRNKKLGEYPSQPPKKTKTKQKQNKNKPKTKEKPKNKKSPCLCLSAVYACSPWSDRQLQC